MFSLSEQIDIIIVYLGGTVWALQDYIQDLGYSSKESRNISFRVHTTYIAAESGMTYGQWAAVAVAGSYLHTASQIAAYVGNGGDVITTRGGGNSQNTNDRGSEYRLTERGQSRGGHQPMNLKERLAMQEAMSSPYNGVRLFDSTDLRWSGSTGWGKYTQNINGVEVHYQYNPLIRAIDDFKIK